MSNQTRVFLIQSDKFLHQIISAKDFADFVKEETGNQLPVSEADSEKPIILWIREVVAQLQSNDEIEFIAQNMVEFLLGQSLGLYHLADFDSGGMLNNDLETLKPLLPERFQARIEYAFSQGKDGSSFPPDEASDLAVLNEIEPAWIFFTRQEIIDIRPIVLEVIEDENIDFYDDEWHQVITAHARYEYDWLAFRYMV